MDIVRSKKNILTSVAFKIILLAVGILTTRFLIRTAGNEINGLNSLYKSIVGFLTIAELGVGTAISYCMYKPIVEGNDAIVSALYKLFKKIYFGIAAIILIVGLLVMPLLPILAKDYTVETNIFFTYALMLASVVISYFYSAKTSLINAYKDNYITTTIYSGGMILQQVLQIVVLILFQSFELYLTCRILTTILQWIVTEHYANKKHIQIISRKETFIPDDLKSDISRNVKAMFLHKIGGALVNSTGSIIISAFCGVAVLGMYSNYVSIMVAMVGVLGLFFTPLTAIIGHVHAEKNGDSLQKYYNFFYGVNYILGVIFFLGYFAVIDDVVTAFYGENLEMRDLVVILITISYFTQFLRQSTLLFRDSTGTFYYDRWKPVIEGVVNVLLALALIAFLPEELQLIGVLVSTIFSNLFICHIIEPYVLYKHVFRTSIKTYYIKNYILTIVFVVMVCMYRFMLVETNNPWLNILVNGCISMLVSWVSIPFMVLINKDFRYYFARIIKEIWMRLKLKISGRRG